MTTKQAFTDAEWEQILEGPPSAGMLVIAIDSIAQALG